MTIINNSKVQGTLGVNFTLILLCICFERFMYSRIDDDWTGEENDHTDKISRMSNKLVGMMDAKYGHKLEAKEVPSTHYSARNDDDDYVPSDVDN